VFQKLFLCPNRQNVLTNIMLRDNIGLTEQSYAFNVEPFW